MSLADDTSALGSPCLVLVRPEAQGQFTAELMGLSDLYFTAPSREAAVEGVRSLLRDWIEAGKLQRVGIPGESSLMPWFGHARNDPDFDDYVQEIRRQREALEDSLLWVRGAYPPPM